MLQKPLKSMTYNTWGEDMDFRERLMEAVRISGKTRAQLAERVGVTPATISNWMLGKVGGIGADTAARLEAETGIRASWIITGEGPKTILDRPEDSVPAVRMKSVPCISREQALTWLENPDPHAQGATPEWLLSHRPMSRLAFALKVTDGSMRPLFTPGDHVIIDPETPAVPGWHVAAEVRGQGVILRKYRPLSLNESGVQSFELIPLCDDYPVIRSEDVPSKLMGCVVEHRRYGPNSGN